MRRGPILHDRKGAIYVSAGDFHRDFLLTRTKVTRVQLVGLLILGINLIAGGIVIWAMCIWEFAGSTKASDIAILVLGSTFSAFVEFMGYLHIKRAFIGRD